MTGAHGNSIEIGQSEQELVSTKNGSKLTKGLCIGFIMLVIIGLCVSVYIYYGTKGTESTIEDKLIGKPAISLTDILDNKFYARHSNATWISDDELLYKDEDSNVVTFNVVTNKTTVLAGIDIPSVAASFSQELSPDHRYLLLALEYQKIFRHSAMARYEILDLETQQIYKLANKSLLLAQWGPVGNSIVFIQDNNIFFKPSVEEEDIEITDDGSVDIFNGICDWVYEEEVFSTKTAVWISPDNKQMAYVRFDDSPVNHIRIPYYGIPGAPIHQYPSDIEFPYPKTGTNNPLVKLFLVDLSTATPHEPVQKVEIPVPESLRDIQHIISVVSWANNETMLSTWMNRVQNQAIVQTCKGAVCKQILNLVSTAGWIDLFKAPTFNADGSQFVYLMSQEQQGLNDSYRHLTLVSTATGKQTALTSGEYVVSDVLYWDAKSNYIFYSANVEDAPQVKQIYGVQGNEKVDGERKKFCLTCGTERLGIAQTYFGAVFSPHGKHIILTDDGPSLPRTDIVRLISPDSPELKFVMNWEDNKNLNLMLENTSKPKIKYHTIPLKNGFDAFVKLQLPPNVDLSGKTKYPMLIDVYAGPGSFNGYDRWEIGFGSYLVTNRSYILAQINGRGSGNRGDRLLHTIYRSMGTVEVEDQIETAKKLTELFPFIDENHVGIWGWSYGGFTSGLALAKDDAHIFKCAASVAPVTDWTYYDTIYTERYMGLPTKEDNLAGYDRSRLSTKPRLFSNKTYLLVHGSLDDNVHYQQSMALARSLELADIPFEQITYPDEDHSLWGVRRHLYHALDKFFKTCFEV